MKTKNLLLTICLLCGSLAHAQNSTMNKLFDKYENEDDITVISISKAMFKMIPGNIYTDNVDLKSILHKIESMRLIRSNKTDLRKKMHSDFKSLIDKDKNYEELVRIRDGKTTVTFNARKSGTLINELIMLVNEEENFVAIQILGNFTLEEIQEITKDRNTQ
ncbi:MAG: DUF4252 domain-containing protein [Tannerella sp.]|jgi:uncharacterized protein YlbG (UPF0298 family)|nr:DUF4252 domain-containing protein [Tannerella sp.]